MLNGFSLIKVAARIKDGRIIYCEDNQPIRDEQDYHEQYAQFMSRIKHAVKHDIIYSDKVSFSASATWSSSVGDPGTVAFQTDINASGSVTSGTTDAGSVGSDSFSNDTWNTDSVSLSDYSIQYSTDNGADSNSPTDGASPTGTKNYGTANGDLASNNNFSSNISGLTAGQTKKIRWTIGIRTDATNTKNENNTITHTYQELS